MPSVVPPTPTFPPPKPPFSPPPPRFSPPAPRYSPPTAHHLPFLPHPFPAPPSANCSLPPPSSPPSIHTSWSAHHPSRSDRHPSPGTFDPLFVPGTSSSNPCGSTRPPFCSRNLFFPPSGSVQPRFCSRNHFAGRAATSLVGNGRPSRAIQSSGRTSPVTAGRDVRRWCQALPGPHQSCPAHTSLHQHIRCIS